LVGEDAETIQTGRAVSLQAHIDHVVEWTKNFGEELLDPQLLEILLKAARWHDQGKADPRFQLLLHRGDAVAHACASQLLAKSEERLAPGEYAAVRARVGYPKGYRHELLSAALWRQSGEAATELSEDSVTYFIGTHHGRCRALVVPVEEKSPETVEITIDGANLSCSTDHEFDRLDSGWVELFHAMQCRFGAWGCAYLEAILRLADQRASQQEIENQEEEASCTASR